MSALTGPATPRTRADEIRVTVRRDILRGHLRPGERLSPSVLAQECGVSLSVVREALTSLAEQGLVVSQPQHGFQVTPISRADLLDLTSVRLDIEALALRRSVLTGDVEWRTALVAAHYRLEHTPQHEPGVEPGVEPFVLDEDWVRAHKVFHDQLLSACGSRRLLEMAESLRESADLYRRWSVPIGRDRARDVVSEHRALFDAAQSGDADLAVQHLLEHISHTTDVLLEHAT